jgi:hypothetical protein
MLEEITKANSPKASIGTIMDPATTTDSLR